MADNIISGMDIPLSDKTGVLRRHASFASKFIDPRHIDIWLPPNYNPASPDRYPVFYMHDGQNLFDPVLAYVGVDWGVDEILSCLSREEHFRGAIVVGIWNTSKRWYEYMPQKPLPRIRKYLKRKSWTAKFTDEYLSDAYLKFLVSELKPFVDANYRTLPDLQHTFSMGSSLGAMISLYALVEYPKVFGGAGCLSIPWPIGENDLVDYFCSVLPKPGLHKYYFDYGTQTSDGPIEPFQLRMDKWLAKSGYQDGVDWLSRRFVGAEHTESAWRDRLHIPLRYFLNL